jgi:hypothetical protein
MRAGLGDEQAPEKGVSGTRARCNATSKNTRSGLTTPAWVDSVMRSSTGSKYCLILSASKIPRYSRKKVVDCLGGSRGTWGGGLIFDALGSYDRAWQTGVLIGFGAGIIRIVAGGPTRRRGPEKRPSEMMLVPSTR